MKTIRSARRSVARSFSKKWTSRLVVIAFALIAGNLRLGKSLLAEDGLRLSSFAVDASPPLGSPLAYDPTREITQPLSCRGIVLLGAGQPIVLCTVDWLGVANESNEVFRAQLAKAAGTISERVTVHTLHQHDAPRCDLGAAKLLEEVGHGKQHYDIPFIEGTFERAATALKQSLESSRAIDGIAFGMAEVKEVASNRRMLDAQGKVVVTRYTACRDEAIRNLPVGVVDPQLRLVTFYAGDDPIASLSFFATHPQSYYRTGGANPDFPGMARNAHQAETGVFHLHFNGAGGNVGAGKYNDGSKPMRQVLADRVRSGMQRAAESQAKKPLRATDVSWEFESVSLPVADHLQESQLVAQVKEPAIAAALRVHAADQLSFLRRASAGHEIQISCLNLGECSILFMPGELFVEYQLAAAHMRPDRQVMMAAYGDYGPFYIGTRIAYPQGGYETSPRATNVAPEVEEVLLAAMSKLLKSTEPNIHASDFTETVGPGLPNSSKTGD